MTDLTTNDALHEARPPPPTSSGLVESGARAARLKHTTASRWMHWINFPLLTIMIWSGMRIYWADLQDPYRISLGNNQLFQFWPAIVNQKLGLEQRLARGMAFHFTFGWLFAINGTAYGLYLWRSGEWRQLVPERSTLVDSTKVFLHDVGIGRKNPLPPQARYNGAQRLTYSIIIAMGALVVITGLAIYKPTQLSPLTWLLGGYERARTIHFLTTIGFLGFFVVHILQVVRAGWGNFMSMVTGYQLEPAEGIAEHRTPKPTSVKPIHPKSIVENDDA